ncbi:MAG: class I SAM-dependent methyltransferase [Bacteroidia bacterium]|nr:class I SAM-dependent methyltransferase [Bacteroidia bacterium]
MHSPFVYHFYTQVLHARITSETAKIETLRKSLQKSTLTLELEDFGAGKGGNGGGKITRSLREIARLSARRPREGNLLYRICRQYQPKTCLELGTNIGISALYQLSGLKNSRFITLEGSAELAEIARKNITDFGFHAEIYTGEFSALLAKINLAELKPDYVFLDGNHRYEATMFYAQTILPHIPEGGILILDDIYWSEEMQKAWKEIILLPEVTVSIDLFFMGICFVRRPQAKQSFIMVNG